MLLGAVDYSARVWVNGKLAATHEGGHTPFFADITDMLRRRQAGVVRAEDDPHDLTKPRGKQDWQLEPHSIWYPRTTGIWQTVWLERVPHLHRQDPLDAAPGRLPDRLRGAAEGRRAGRPDRGAGTASTASACWPATATAWWRAKSTASSCCRIPASTIPQRVAVEPGAADAAGCHREAVAAAR
jgi:hypothetical protein